MILVIYSILPQLSGVFFFVGKNVHIILGAVTEYPILTTVKSRVRKLRVQSFSDETLERALISECPDRERLKEAISLAGGSVGKALTLYGEESLTKLFSFADDLIVNMQSSKQVLKFSHEFSGTGASVSDLLSVLETKFRDMLLVKEKAEDLIKYPGKYTQATSYGCTKYINNIRFNEETGEIPTGLELSLKLEKIKEEDSEETGVRLRRLPQKLIPIKMKFRRTAVRRRILEENGYENL